MTVPRSHPLFFTSLGTGYSYKNPDLGRVMERDGDQLQFSLSTGPEMEEETKQTLAWQRIGWQTFSSLNPLRLRDVADYIGLAPLEGVFTKKQTVDQRPEGVDVDLALNEEGAFNRSPLGPPSLCASFHACDPGIPEVVSVPVADRWPALFGQSLRMLRQGKRSTLRSAVFLTLSLPSISSRRHERQRFTGNGPQHELFWATMSSLAH